MEDGDIRKEAILNRLNGELANEIGNLFSRVSAMVLKYLDGKAEGQKDQEYENFAMEVLEEYEKRMQGIDFYNALEAVLRLSSYLNKYVDAKAPWSLAKTDQEALKKVLYTLTDGLHLLANLLEPFMPSKMKTALEVLSCDPMVGELRPYLKAKYTVKEKLLLFPKR